MAQLTPALSSNLPEDLGPGTLLKSSLGRVQVVRAGCLHEGSLALMVIYQDLEAPYTSYTRPLDEFSAASGGDAALPYSAVPPAKPQALAAAWRAQFQEDGGLEQLLTGYDETWRRLHTRRYIYRLFEIAAAHQQPLSKPEVLALLLCRLISVSDVPEPGSVVRACMHAKGLLPQAKAVDWTEVQSLLQATGTSPVRDLLASPLAVTAAEFEINEELRWLESLQGLQPPPSRKIHDSARLRTLLERAGAGPLFSPDRPDLERCARTNIEKLRQTWLKSWGQP